MQEKNQKGNKSGQKCFVHIQLYNFTLNSKIQQDSIDCFCFSPMSHSSALQEIPKDRK